MPPRHLSRARQRGVVLIYTLIALVVMLIGAVALSRSFNTTLSTAGNVAFKRDLQNRGEQATVELLARFSGAGALATEAARSADNAAINYRASRFPDNEVNAQGVPLALISASTVTDPLPRHLAPGGGVTIFYRVDRQCTAAGLAATLGPSNCLLADAEPEGGSSGNPNRPRPPGQVVYRLSIRVDGPRDTQAYFQTTFTAGT